MPYPPPGVSLIRLLRQAARPGPVPARVDRGLVNEPSPDRDEALPQADPADRQDQAQSVDEESPREPDRLPLEADPADVLEQSIVEPLDDEDL